MKPNVMIRVDGNNRMGLGHLVRCIALADMLSEKFSIKFVCKEVPEKIAADIQGKEFALTRIEDENDFLNILNAEDIIVLDGYHFSTNYQKQIKRKGNLLVYIDDLHDQEFVADLVINHAPSVKIADYNAQPYTQFALGLDYALLRSPFLHAAGRAEENKVIKTVLICFGGSDYKNLTSQVLEEVIKDTRFEDILVVTGATYEHNDILLNVIGDDNRVVPYNNVDEREMAELLHKADVAIIPSSGILLETLASGCLAISGMYIENQKIIYNQYKEKQLIIDAMDFSPYHVQEAITKCFEAPQKNKLSIDGRSGKRIERLFSELFNLNKITVRPLQASDLDITYSWATNEIIRAYSFQKHTIAKEEHQKWFKAKLEDKNCIFYIAEFEGNRVGSIRFDMVEDDAVISYLLDPLYHGKGLGKLILKKGMDALCESIDGHKARMKKVVGYVEEHNTPSIKAFESLQYHKIQEQNRFRFEKTIDYEAS